MHLTSSELLQLSNQIKQWGLALGFADVGITHTNLTAYEAAHFNWIGNQFHGEMDYMARHGTKRTRPTELEPGTTAIISVRLNYLDLTAHSPFKTLHTSQKAYISRYALGKDYHKLLRNRLKQLGQRIEKHLHEETLFRPFVDSAPVLERPIARNAGLGWIGKHTLLLNREAGSWFFLGELFINLPLPIDPPEEKGHCGKCTACLDVCPTKAFPQPYVLDARRCISYLTIEHKGSIPEEFRKPMGNRIFGCDDCQLFCPWNRFAQHSHEDDFKPRHHLDDVDLITLFQWDEATFLKRTEGSAIRRTGFEGWQRNIAIALGNSDGGTEVIDTLTHRLRQPDCSALLAEHIHWAIQQLTNETDDGDNDATLR